MSPPFTEALRCSYKGQRETKTSDVAAMWLHPNTARISFVKGQPYNSQPQA